MACLASRGMHSRTADFPRSCSAARRSQAKAGIEHQIATDGSAWWLFGQLVMNSDGVRVNHRVPSRSRQLPTAGHDELGPESPSKIDEVTLMRPIHGNLK